MRSDGQHAVELVQRIEAQHVVPGIGIGGDGVAGKVFRGAHSPVGQEIGPVGFARALGIEYRCHGMPRVRGTVFKHGCCLDSTNERGTTGTGVPAAASCLNRGGSVGAAAGEGGRDG